MISTDEVRKISADKERITSADEVRKISADKELMISADEVRKISADKVRMIFANEVRISGPEKPTANATKQDYFLKFRISLNDHIVDTFIFAAYYGYLYMYTYYWPVYLTSIVSIQLATSSIYPTCQSQTSISVFLHISLLRSQHIYPPVNHKPFIYYAGCSGKIVFYHNSLQPLPRLHHRCKRPSELSPQCERTVTPIGR